MNILVVCEESQAITKEMRKKGHNAYSCDLKPCSGGRPEWHIQGDCIEVIERNIDNIDMIIAHPPCTDLATSGARHFEKKRENGTQEKSIIFFGYFLALHTRYPKLKLAIENPKGIMSGGNYIKEHFPHLAELVTPYTQIIQPYEYGDPYRKTTCLWLYNLPCLVPTNIVEPKLVTYTKANGKKTTFSADFCGGYKNAEDRSTKRSKTYPGIAQAIAEQWG